MWQMEAQIIRHPPRHISYTVLRRLEIERDCPECPDGLPQSATACPDCDSTMAYRGKGRLTTGMLVHYFECVHSHREVHAVSVVITD